MLPTNAERLKQKARLHAPLMLISASILLAAMWMGLQRANWDLASWAGITPVGHGGAMVAGFLGTLISLERTIALQKKWVYLIPALNGLGAILILLGVPLEIGRFLLALGAFGFVIVSVYMFSKHRTLDVAFMGTGAGALFVANVIWLVGQPMYQVVPWWIAFLVMTIAGERLELSRVMRPTRATKLIFISGMIILLAGLVVSLVSFEWGVRIAGIGLVSLAAWLISKDIARRTITKAGLTRFIAACLLPGYGWMLVGGSLWILYAQYFVGGMYYDAMLHAIFIGFGLSMIFGHEPIILPAILNVPIAYLPQFYVHLALLHSALLLRIIGDLALNQTLQQWGAMLNVIAVLIFMVNTIVGVTVKRKSLKNQQAQSVV